MGGHFISDATVLSIKPLGENNSSVSFITKERGIINAVMYGGRKSRLKSLVSVWNSGTAYFSESNGKFLKISDFDVKNYHISFRESLQKIWMANLAGEIAVKTNCTGNNEAFWRLFRGFIDGLELCTTEKQCKLGLIRFLWRLLEIMGVQPDINSCYMCSKSFFTGKTSDFKVSCSESFLAASYSPFENSFICNDCAVDSSWFYLSPEAIGYLFSITVQSPSKARQIFLSDEAYEDLRKLLLYMLQNTCSTKFNSLETGRGIL